MGESKIENRFKGSYLGAIFLMAITAIGPGFLMQTTVFTQKTGASFGFVILASVVIDILVQINVWRIIVASGMRGQEIGNTVLPGLGYFISILIVMGGLCFNIGNVAGASLGLNVLFGTSIQTGAIISGIIALSIFCFKQIGKIMDSFVSSFGIVRILLAVFVAVAAMPPVGEAVVKSFVPDQIDVMALITLIGGSVGGYITFSGGHRLLDAGIQGIKYIPQATRSAVSGILITGVMRVVLFLGALGVIVHGHFIDPANPAASVFQAAAGDIGYKLFGIVIWSAGTTSVIGCAYTSVSFLKSFSKKVDEYYSKIIIGFIIFSTIVFVIVGQPVKVLVVVGTINGFILPLALASILVGAYNKKIVGEYKHPVWMTVTGVLVVAIMGYMSVRTFINQFLM
ncbi:NRAMP family divalent metal transporter [Sporomusa acidovorans]|uniref:Divalent metal cation transporter MntH n=1 Tax=Sporomusa acidovorans (strain ATCC 49682 / DSM 3132 / Mol) TaxID=1123286 RepID=A0ABZ3IZB7_SPOA4|nr:NRAMP family divalent metal transporter [Sporomusa acidovorans]OZC17267.1 divalent metal cation transporter MntH [Sporomusa acidovorans DSM 3132]SDF16146.1 Mn2+ and Fe2+ transporters of the NRAMP family [Sporomusa acidovorans]